LIQPVAGPIRLPTVIAIWFVGWLISNLSIAAGMRGYSPTVQGWTWSNYLSFIGLVGGAAGSALMLYHFRRPTMLGWIWLLSTLGFGIVSALAIATRSAALVFLRLVMHIYYAKGKLYWWWLIVGLASLAFLVPAANAIRANLLTRDTGGGVTFSERLDVVGRSLQEVLNSSPRDLIDDTTHTFKDRQGSLLHTTASVVTLHPATMPFVGLDMLKYFLQQLIPRLLWPGKPTGGPQVYMVTSIYADNPSEQGGTAIGLFADSYRAGGWLFVALWFVALGALCAWLYRQGPGSGNLAGTVFYLSMLTTVIVYDTNIVSLALHLIQMAPLVWAMTMFVLFVPLRNPFRPELGTVATHRKARETLPAGATVPIRKRL
jgi:hypothetical protein